MSFRRMFDPQGDPSENRKEDMGQFMEMIAAGKQRQAKRMHEEMEDLKRREARQRAMAPFRGAIGGAISGLVASGGNPAMALAGAAGGALASSAGASQGEIAGYGQLAVNQANADRQMRMSERQNERWAAAMDRLSQSRAATTGTAQQPRYNPYGEYTF